MSAALGEPGRLTAGLQLSAAEAQLLRRVLHEFGHRGRRQRPTADEYAIAEQLERRVIGHVYRLMRPAATADRALADGQADELEPGQEREASDA
jgi:hypothetical protein